MSFFPPSDVIVMIEGITEKDVNGVAQLRANLVPYLTKVHDLDTTLASLYIGFMSLGNSMGGIASGLVMKRFDGNPRGHPLY